MLMPYKDPRPRYRPDFARRLHSLARATGSLGRQELNQVAPDDEKSSFYQLFRES